MTHRNAAAFVDAEAGLFLRGDPLGPGDRVLAGLSVAFDASCEEMWLAWRHGGCLVPAPRSVVRTGPDLVTWLAQRRVSVVSTVPTLASLWPGGSPPGVRLLVLGGEVCPGGLAGQADPARHGGVEHLRSDRGHGGVLRRAAVRRRAGAHRAAAGRMAPGRGPPRERAAGPVGEAGELVIGGVGLARYLDAKRDAVDFRPLEALGWERAYHTGDLVRADPEGLIYLRPGQGTGGLAAAVGQGRLPASDRPEPGRRGHRATWSSRKDSQRAGTDAGVTGRHRAIRGVRSAAIAGLPGLGVPRRGGPG